MSGTVKTRLITRSRQVVALRAAEIGVALAAGILIGRGYSAAFTPPEPTQWWSLKIQGDGAVHGPLTIMGGKGQTLLELKAGASLIREGNRLRLIGDGFNLRNYQVLPQPDPSPPPARGRDTTSGGTP